MMINNENENEFICTVFMCVWNFLKVVDNFYMNAFSRHYTPHFVKIFKTLILINARSMSTNN